MRIMVDTNVLISALLFPKSRVSRVFERIALEHTLVLSSFVIDELRAVVERKFPERARAVDLLLEAMRYEMVFTPETMKPGLFEIRDKKDYPVLYSAMTNDIDILVTGDRDFADVQVGMPRIMTPAQFEDEILSR